MKRITNISQDAYQRHRIIYDPQLITLDLRFFPTVSIWTMDIEYDDKVINGVKLSTGVTHLESNNLGFDFIVTDNTGQGIDPFQLNDFESGRCSLFLLDPGDLE